MIKIKKDRHKEDEHRQVALFITYKDIESSASLIYFIKSVAEEGYTVDIFSPNTYKIISDYGYENITFYIYRELDRGSKSEIIKQIFNSDVIRHSLLKLCRYVKLHGIKAGILYSMVLAKNLRFLHLNYVHSIIKNNEYRCFIGVERMGLIVADLVNYNEVPLIYYSLELYYSTSPGILPRFTFNMVRGLEIIAHHNAIATIIQDEERAKVLFEYNKVSEDKQEILYLPVSMLGDSFKERTDFFYETLGIPRDKKILLQFGMIGSLRMSVEIAKSAQNWPDDLVLVMHGTFDEDAKRLIRELNKKGNIFLSEKKVPFADIPRVVASAHIGLVFYRISNYNYYNNYYISSSSGQLAHYLQCGIPIITLNIPSLKRVIDGFQCGLAVDDADSIVESAKIIFNNYEFFRENAFKCFEERYCFEKYFENIDKFIKSLA